MSTGTIEKPLTIDEWDRRDTILFRVLPPSQWPLTMLVMRIHRRNPAGLPTEYVNHWWNGEIGGFHNGGYHSNLAEAIAEFNERAKRVGVELEKLSDTEEVT